jgi:hypothetical protein
VKPYRQLGPSFLQTFFLVGYRLPFSKLILFHKQLQATLKMEGSANFIPLGVPKGQRGISAAKPKPQKVEGETPGNDAFIYLLNCSLAYYWITDVPPCRGTQKNRGRDSESEQEREEVD